MNITTKKYIDRKFHVKKCLVLVDADNTNYHQVPGIIEETHQFADQVEVRCYGDWHSEILKPWKPYLVGLNITFVQQTPVGGKNSTDTGILIDGSEAIALKRCDALVIVSRDRDFVPMINKAKSEGLFVVGAGYMPVSKELINACDDFIVPDKATTVSSNLPTTCIISRNQKNQWAVDAICTAIEKYGKNGFANLSDIGNYLRYLDPNFTAWSLGKKKLVDFISDYPSILRMRSYMNNPVTRTTTVYVGRA